MTSTVSVHFTVSPRLTVAGSTFASTFFTTSRNDWFWANAVAGIRIVVAAIRERRENTCHAPCVENALSHERLYFGTNGGTPLRRSVDTALVCKSTTRMRCALVSAT